jgi:hypothetical protein
LLLCGQFFPLEYVICALTRDDFTDLGIFGTDYDRGQTKKEVSVMFGIDIFIVKIAVAQFFNFLPVFCQLTLDKRNKHKCVEIGKRKKNRNRIESSPVREFPSIGLAGRAPTP